MSIALDETIAFSEGESRFGYMGWRVVFAMFLVTATIFGVALYGFIIIAQAMASEYGWSAAQSGSLVSAMWLTAPLALFCAPIIRRVGSWRLLVTGLVVEAAAFAALAFVDAFWQVYTLRMTMGAAKVLSIVTMPVVIADWFSKRFGIAVAAAWCGGAFGGLALSPVAEALVQGHGWRLAVLALAALTLTVAIVVGLIGLSAARSAQRPNLAASAPPGPGRADAGAASGVTPSILQSVGTFNPATVAAMVFAVAASGIAVLAFAIETPPLLTAIGFSPAVAALILGLFSAGGMGGNLLAGWALDHFKVRWTSLGVAAAIGTGLGIFYNLSAMPVTALAVLAGALVGAGMGASEILWITLTKRQFGAPLFAVTYGGWSFSYQLGYAVAGSVAGWIFVRVSHTDFLLVIGCLCLPAILFSLWRPGMQNEETVGDR